MKVLAAFLLLLAISLEGSFVSLPFVLLLLIVLQIAYASAWIFSIAFVSGFLLDTLLFRQFGQTSFFFLAFLLLIVIYERRFEIRTLPFLLGAILVGTSSYLILFGSAQFLWQVVIMLLLGLFLYPVFVGKQIKRHELSS